MGKQVHSDPGFVALYPLGASLALSDDFVLGLERLGPMFESPFGNQFAAAFFAPEGQIPVLRKLLCARQTLFFCGRPMVLALHEGRALPETAVFAPINVDFAAQNRVFRHGTNPRLHMCENV